MGYVDSPCTAFEPLVGETLSSPDTLPLQADDIESSASQPLVHAPASVVSEPLASIALSFDTLLLRPNNGEALEPLVSIALFLIHYCCNPKIKPWSL